MVLDYLWRLSDHVAGGLTIDHCEQGNTGQLPADIQGYACTMSNNAIFVVERVPQGPENWIVSYVALVDGGIPGGGLPPGGGPSGTESACGSSGESFSPSTPDEKLLVSYFRAINSRDYATAWNLLGDELQSGFGSEQAFTDLMAQHVSCVRVLDIESRGGQTYQLQFAAQYETPFPAGSGALQDFWTVSGGKIVGSGTGP